LKKGYSWADIISAQVIAPEEYEHFTNVALQKFYEDL
jgi:hypothetical protein